VDTVLLVSFLAATVRVATPLLLAALGETLAERGGVINLGIEGAMLAGALGASVGATHGGVWAGVVLAIVAGLAVAAAFAGVAVGARADQIITGTAITLGCIGLTGAVYRQAYGPGGVGLSLPTLPVVGIPVLERIPVIGPAFFQQSVLTYVGFVAAPVLWFALFRTAFGLRLRAAGESAEHATAAGVHVRRIRTMGVLVGGGLAGLAGASLVLAQVGTFAEKMTAGRGFMAIAIVVLGAWHPGRVLGAALFFGAAMALQFLFQSSLSAVPYQLFLMLPYLLTLLVLAGAVGRTRAPADLGRGH
jgi:simple sugar transport system permease protein